MDYKEEILKINIIMQILDYSDFKNFEKEILEQLYKIAERTPYTIKSIINEYYYLISEGFKSDEAIKFLSNKY